MNPSTLLPLRVYYDGACRVCSVEMEHYRRLDRAGRLVFVDIAAADFDPAPLGLPVSAFQAQLHVRTADGRWLTAIDAFLALWNVLPGVRFRLLRRLVGAPLLRPLADAGYRLFARYRYLLPQKPCDGACRIHGK
jgi:predicted DCC family thiol-disulfide oxidoreductase YuxK